MNTTTLTLLLLVSCRAGIGRMCDADADCREPLRCISSMCTTWGAPERQPEDGAVKAKRERARAFLKERFHMADATAAQLCIAGESAIIARDKAHRWEFCLKTTGETFDVMYTGAITATPCNGALGDAMEWGDMVNVCR